ncbi:unnamed protein product [Closterium sp. Naga37s-1]|nr:unnamed protein product [Closterium sp. Naga37s-1]
MPIVGCAGVVIRAKGKGWVDERLVQVLVPFLKPLRDEGGRDKQALLVLESYKGNLTQAASQLLKTFKMTRAVIPGDRTSHWCNYLTYPSAAASTARFASATALAESWADVPEELVRKSFLTCGISDAEDGNEDHPILARLRDNTEMEVLEDVQEEADDGALPNPFYEDLAGAPEAAATEEDKDVEVVDDLAKEWGEDASMSDEAEDRADDVMRVAEWSNDGDEWWALCHFEGEEVEGWVAGEN